MDRLPTELLIKVFEHLNYRCLKYTLSRVNKRFQSSNKLDWKSDYQIHQIGIIYNASGGSQGRAPLRLVDFDSICRLENAISPAVMQVHIVNQDILVEEGSGIHSAVTVLDLVKGVDRIFCKMAEWGGHDGVWQPWGE